MYNLFLLKIETKQSLVLTHIRDIPDEEKESEKPETISFTPMSRDVFEASTVIGKQFVTINDYFGGPTAKPTASSISRDKFEASQVIEVGSTVVVVPPSEKPHKEDEI